MQPQQRMSNIIHFSYQKSSDEIIEKSKAKIELLKAKISDRTARISALRAEYGITDAVLIDLLTQARKAQKDNDSRMSYVSNAPVQGGGMQEITIGAGVVNNLLTENDFIESERAAVKDLERIIRNLKPIVLYSTETGARYYDDCFNLTDAALDYLGF